MKRIVLLSLMISSLVIYSCEDDQLTLEDQNATTDLSPESTFPDIAISPLNGRLPLKGHEIQAAVEKMTDQPTFSWRNVDDFLLWSGVMAGDGTVAIGVKPLGAQKEYSPGSWELEELEHAKQYIQDYVAFLSKDDNVNQKTSFSFESYEAFPIMWAKIDDYEILAKLRKLEAVRYIEPNGFDLIDPVYEAARTHGSGCAGDANYANDADRYSSPGLPGKNYKVSWHLYANNIPAAWKYSNGDNVMIGMVDTGVGKNQTLFNNEFGTGRTIVKSRTIKFALKKKKHPYDDCGHGSSMAGIMVGPMNNKGAMIGAAYMSDLHSVKIANGVIIDGTRERKGFVKALEKLGNDSRVKVINISLGRLNGRDDMKDAINYANSKGKLIFCAAGSALGLEVFPAKHSGTISVTGVVYDPVNDPKGTSLKVINSDGVHNAKGSSVDFAAYLKRKSDGDYALGLNRKNYLSKKALGSSAASATVSAIAALIWSANPSLTKSQVLQLMKNAASYQRYNGSKSSNFGYGVIDAEKAVKDAINF